MRISLDGSGSKIWKVSKCRPTVSKETILATTQEFYFTKVAPVQGITDILLLVFWLILLPGMFSFILHCHLIFRKEFFILNVYISANTLFKWPCLSFGWEIDHPLSMYVTRGMEVGSSICVQVRTGGEGYHASCVHKHLHYLFSCFCLMVSCFICRNLTLSSFKKGVFVRNRYFSPMRSINVAMK